MRKRYSKMERIIAVAKKSLEKRILLWDAISDIIQKKSNS